MEHKLKAARSRLAAACEARDAAYRQMEESPDTITSEELAVLADAFDAAQADVERNNEAVGRIERITEARSLTPTIVAADSGDDDEGDDATGHPARRFASPKGGQEERTYTPDTPYSFFNDLAAVRQGDYNAAERLRKHSEETRDLTTVATDGGGFAPPTYLQDLYSGLPRQGRPFADVVGRRPMPANAGPSFSLPRITTGATVAVTSTENAAVNEVDMVEEVITRTVVTTAGQQDLSMQLYEMSRPSIDAIIFGDLLRDYDNKQDTGLISGAGSSGTHLGLRAVTGVNTVTYSDASPTAAELWPKLFDAIQKVASNRFVKPDLILMHPRRSAWLASQLSTSFPLLQQGQLQQAGGTQNNGFVQSIAGIPVIDDANIGTTYGAATNEDEIYVLSKGDLVLFEDEPRTRVLSEVGSGTLTVRLQVYGFSLWFAGRYPSSIAVISGSGLAAPSF